MARVLLLTILMLGPAAGAQIALGGPPLGGLPGGVPGSLPTGLPGGLPGAGGLPFGAQQTLGTLTDDAARLQNARTTRLLHIRLLLRRHSDVLEADPSGNPIVRGEVLAFSPTDAALARAVGAGFSIVRQRSLGSLGMRIVVLGVPPGTRTSRALSLLRRLDPAGTYDFNNIYTESGEGRPATHGPGGLPQATPSDTVPLRAKHPRTAARSDLAQDAAGQATQGNGAIALGLIDGGVGTAQPVFAGTVIHRHGCGGAVVPSAHGTEVASLMVGRSARFGGAAPGAILYAADVYCGKPTGGAVDAIAEALEWLVAQRVAVINVSLVGPPNVLLQQVVARLVASGFLLVAAVGNDGPAAPPLYPAAYPGVIGVTAVDARRQVIFEAERGPQVMFAAPGAEIPAAAIPDGFENVRGTSFAAPLVAGLLAERLHSMGAASAARSDPDAGSSGPMPSSGAEPAGVRAAIGDPAPLPGADPAAARAAIDALARAAIHLGAPGRNPVFGYGLVGADLPSPRPGAKE